MPSLTEQVLAARNGATTKQPTQPLSLTEQVLQKKRPPQTSPLDYLTDVLTQAPTGVAQGLINIPVGLGGLATRGLGAITPPDWWVEGERTPEERARVFEDIYQATRLPEARTEPGRQVRGIAEFLGPAVVPGGQVAATLGAAVRATRLAAKAPKIARATEKVLGGAGAWTTASLLKNLPALEAGKITPEEYWQEGGVSAVTGGTMGGAGLLSTPLRRVAGELGALTFVPPAVAEQRFPTLQEAVYATVTLGGFKVGMNYLAGARGVPKEQIQGEIFARAKAEGKPPRQVLMEDLEQLQKEPVAPLPEGKEIPRAETQGPQGQEVLRPVETQVVEPPIRPETPIIPPPPSALGTKPQPGTTELPGATPKVEPKGYGAETLPQGEGVTPPTKNGLERADIVNIPVAGIQTKYQPREGLNKEQVTHIVENYDPNLFDPIVVNQEPGGMYVISGHHRLEASKKLGLTEVPAKVLSVPEAEARKLAGQANENRLEHSPLEQAKIYAQAQAEGLSLQDIAKRYNKGQYFVQNRLFLNDLSPGLKEFIRNNPTNVAHWTEFAKAVNRYKWVPATQDELLRSVYVPYGRSITAENFRTMLDTFAPQVSTEQLGLGVTVQKTDLKDKLAQFFKTIKELENKESAYKTLIRASVKLGGEESSIPEIRALLGKREQLEAEIHGLRERIDQAIKSAGFGAEKFRPPTTTADVGGYAKTLPLFPAEPTKFKKGDAVYLRTPKGATSSLYEIEDIHITGGGNLYKIKGVKHGVKDWVPEDKLIVQPELFGKKPPTTTADVGGYAKTEAPLKGMELPEIVEIAQEINMGKYPQVKERLRAFGGQARGVFSGKGPEGTIKLRADIFKDPQEAQKVLAHEIGHLVDWLPDKTLARGNILGRVATLKKYLREFLNQAPTDPITVITPKERIELKNRSVKEVMGQDWHWTKGKPTEAQAGQIKEVYKKAIETEAKTRGLISQSTLMGELKTLSQEWKPFDPKADPRFTRYRFSSKELYADAVSVLVNDPALFKQKAPTFHDAFFKYLGRKPEVKKVYEGLQARIRGGKEEVLSAREKGLIEGVERGEELLAEKRPERETLREKGRSFLKEFVDQKWAVIRRVKEVEAGGIVIPPEKNPKYWGEEVPYINSEIGQHLTNVTASRQKAKASGITENDFHLYKLYRRIMTERSSLANPRGQTPESARAGMKFLENRLGAEKFRLLEEAVNAHWELRKEDVLSVLKEAKTHGSDLMKHLEDNENYATFQLNKYIEQAYGKTLGAKIHKQIGTLEDVANVDTATILKDMSLIRYARMQQYYKSEVDFQKTYRPNEYQPAETRWNGKYQEPIEPSDPKKGLLITMEEGKIRGHYLPKDLVDTLTESPLESGVVIRLLQTVSGPLKDVLVSKNPGFFAIWNPIRDIKAFAKAVPEANLWKALKYTIKAVPDAFKEVFRGVAVKDVAEMNKLRALIRGRYWSAKDLPVDTEMERLAVEFGLRPRAYRNKVIEPFAKAWDWLDKPGRFFERITKIGGYKFLKDLQAEKLKAGEHLSDKEIAHIVRKRVGSPDFLAGGRLRLLYNNIYLFSNAGVQGWRGSVEAYKASPSAFVWKTVKYDFMPKLMMYGGLIGLFGPTLKKWFEDIPERDLANYLIVPLGESASGKAVYLIQPHDFFGQFLAGTFWKMVSGTKDRDITQVVDFLSGGLPYTGLNPIIKTMWDWAAYLRGKNPYDDFTGRYVLPENVYEAGGARALGTMAKHSWDLLGGRSFYRFKSDDVREIQGELEKLIGSPIIGPLAQRFVRVSSRGIEEKLRGAVEDVRQKRARENLQAKDALAKLLNKEPLSQEDLQAVATHPDLVKDMLLKGDAKQQNNALLKALLSARSNEEKMAILQRYKELQR